MKKQFTAWMLVVFATLSFTFASLSQDTAVATTEPTATEEVVATVSESEPIIEPTTPVDNSPLASIFISVTAVAFVVLPLTGWIKTKVSILSGAKTQTLSWFVAQAIAFAGYGLQLGIFADAGVLWTFIYGIAAGFTANGLADTALVQGILEALGARVKKSV